MDSPNSSSTSIEVITLNSSQEIDDSDVSDLNLTHMETTTTTVNFEDTLPPGVPPKGFIIIDEDINNSSVLEVSKTDDDDNEKEIRPLFKVLFKDSDIFEKYHKQIENFLKRLGKQHIERNSIKSSISNLTLEIFDSNELCKHSSEVDSSKEYRSNEALFTVDTKPKMQDDLDIPMYGKKFNKALQKNETTEDEEEKKRKEKAGPKMMCFNCLDNHSLRDCPQPRNYNAINKNRKDYNAKRGPVNARYHLDDDQKFGHFVPGQISDNLRRALGIKENELPRHIYRMRMLGYPPGWLEQARLQHSGLALFNSDGLAEADSDEEGEIVCPGDKDQYDVKKIIDFPGFNVLCSEGTRDECKQYWGSPMQEQYSKATMLSYLSQKKTVDGYKRKKLPNPANLKTDTPLNPGDMDVDEVEDTPVECLPAKDLFIPPLPKDDNSECAPPPPPTPLPGIEDSDSQSQEEVSTNSNEENSTSPSSRDGSPSLLDLEYTKKQLLAALDETNSQSNPESFNTSKVESVQNEAPEVNSAKDEESHLNKNDVNSTSATNSPQYDATRSRKSIISVHIGTPILKSCSPYKRLPSSEKFSKDICDVINFENLPDATGKYDQMSELLQKVRQAVTEMQKE